MATPAGAYRRILPAALLLGATAACASAPPRVVSSSRIKARPVARVDWIHGWESALATATAVMERELGIPRFEVVVHLYPGRQAFEQALVAGGYRADFARDTAATLTAIGGHRAVLINAAKLDSAPWERRLALLAHEVAHSLQYELGGGRRGTSDQWLREGFAEWVSLRVLERLDAGTVDEARRRVRLALRGGRGESLPPLAAMVTFPQWVALGQGPHRAVIYDQAFAAVDFLIRRHGAGKAVRYFELFSGSQDRLENFRAAFGEDPSTFEQAFRADLR
ncbi:MAG TPA: hypothetical protein VMT87_11130 [Vicinamibacteria bacterium]|nr:hypothetical protein [Vicinamibacteria bacterium]